MTDFFNAEVRGSQNGELSTSLRVYKADNKIGDKDVFLRSYDGTLVGPTLRIRPGDTMNIRLINDIESVEDLEEPTKDIINLHTHGLHVSPVGNSDNVLLHLEPGKEFESEIKIPKDHPAGTFWYHSHVHGSTAIQVASGLAGALIIEGDIDHVPEIKAASEKIFVLQQPIFDDEGKIETHEKMGFNEWWPEKRYMAINGVVNPTIRMRPGEVQRWRFIHAGYRDAIHLQLSEHQFNEFAVDGLTTGRLDDTKPHIEMHPGYRSDVLIKAGTPGTYQLKDLNMESKDMSGLDDRYVLATVIIEGEEQPMDLPTEASLAPLVPFEDVSDDEITGHQNVEFGIAFDPLRFMVDGRVYDHNNPPRNLQLGAVEEWTLTANLGEHPFHIHINPFQVVRITDLDDIDLDPNFVPVWRDTFAVSSGQKVYFRTRYTKYIGKFVLHCHILDHEDQGMMQLVEVVE